jgi:type I restriction enzyme S subunit
LLDHSGQILSTLIDACNVNASESRTLAQTRDLLLPRLMSGELRVAEAERLEGELA